MKRAGAVVSSLLFLISLAGCAQNSSSGVNSGPVAATSPSPANISSSADIVKTKPASVTLSAGAGADAIVTISISSGFHVNANPATFAYLIPTELTAGPVAGINAAKPIYPKAGKQKFQFANEPLAVYEGEVQIRLPLHAEKNLTPGTQSMPVNIRVQACDHEQCFPPADLKTTLSIEVK